MKYSGLLYPLSLLAIIACFQNCSRLSSSVSEAGPTSLETAPAVKAAAVIAQTLRTMPASECPKGWICPATPLFTSQIGAWYEPWWAGEFPASNTMSWQTVSRYMPLIEGRGHYYDNGNAEDIRDQFKAVKAAGIDYLILDNTNQIYATNGQIEKPWIQENIRKMFEVSLSLPAAERIPMAIAIGGQLMITKNVQLQNSDANYIAERMAQWKPAYFHWQGLPLLVNYNQFSLGAATFAPDWKDEGEGWRFITRNAADNVDKANLYYQGTAVAQHGWWGWTQEGYSANAEAMTVSPGADNVHRVALGGCPAPLRCEETIGRVLGMRYIGHWIAAIKQNPKTIVISSWNEFSDETAIETAYPNHANSPIWTDVYGNRMPDLYVQITLGYSVLRKGLIQGWYYRDESSWDLYKVINSKLVKQASPPTNQAVIVLPEGKLNQLLNQ